MKSNLEQIKASDPFDSVWVSASAGTGKTKVLIDRILRLLLQYGSPEKILCLTFTKAAAAEMNNRLTAKLKDWAIMAKDALSQDIFDITQEIPSDELCTYARTLFTQVLQVPGGMKIMTIHSFCQSILKQFPLEADVPPHFEVMDDLSTDLFINDALDKTLSEPSLYDANAVLSEYVSSNTIIPLFKNLLQNRIHLQHLTQAFPGGIESVIFAIKQFFNIEMYHTEKQIINECCSLQEWETFKTTYLNKNGTIPAKTKDPEKSFLAFNTVQKLKKFTLVQVTNALLKVAYRVLEKYIIYKKQNALLDYTDLIDKTQILLTQSNMAAWVLFKLDGGLNHILVDEAQDTSPDQWIIIKMIADEFFTGESKSDVLRTLFVVGDKKQSIYSFQGADPFEFEKMKNYFSDKVQNSQNTFTDVPLNYSFRSTEPVLRLVNKFLTYPIAKDGVLFNDEQAHHLPNRSNDAGLVEIWPLEQPLPQDKPAAWKPPIERVQSQSAMQRLIDKVADKIATMIGTVDLPSQARKVQAGDFLILLQKRKPMMEPLVRALQQRHIPVAGVDRMILTDYIAIQDMMALTEFVLQPDNDLNLACLLKSPLIGLSENDIYSVCVNRTSSVWQQVQKLFPNQAHILKEIMNLADTCTPFDFYSTILSAFNGRKLFVSRLGLEANEALDEFLNLALAYEKNETPSLQTFLSWLSNQNVEIKRDLEGNTSNAVRIMTVHGSKGLQGNIVFLPDTRGVGSKSSSQGSIFWTANHLPIWIPNADMHVEETQHLLDKQNHLQDQEKRRLLYVALTRASDQLYICGYNPRRGVAKNNWYDLIVNAIDPTLDTNNMPVLHWESEQSEEAVNKKTHLINPDGNQLEKWMFEPAPPEIDTNLLISPSKIGEESTSESDISATDPSRILALKRGTYIHQLLHLLPTMPTDQWTEIIEKITPSDITLPDNFLDIFHNPNFQDLFSPTSLAEVPIIGTWNGMHISGQIDRLIILPDSILLVDFKTNQYVPNQIPDSYKMQLNAYKGLLKQIFPDKIVKSYLLWIQTMQMVEVE